MPLRSTEFYGTHDKRYIFIDLDSVSCYPDDALDDPLSYWCDRLSLETADTKVITYSSDCRLVGTTLSLDSLNIDGYFHVKLEPNDSVTQTESAITIDTMWLAHQHSRGRLASSRKFYVIGNGTLYYNLINVLASFGMEAALYTESAVDASMAIDEDFSTVHNITMEIHRSHPVVPVQIPIVTSTSYPPLFANRLDDYTTTYFHRPRGLATSIIGSSLKVWIMRCRSHFDALAARWGVPENGTIPRRLFQYSQLGNFILLYQDTSISRAGRAGESKLVIEFLVRNLAVEPVVIPLGVGPPRFDRIVNMEQRIDMLIRPFSFILGPAVEKRLDRAQIDDSPDHRVDT